MADIPALITGGAFMVLLLVVAIADGRTMEIPDWCHIAIFALGVARVFLCPGVTVWARLIGALCVSLPMLGLSLAVEGAFGGGDIKLMAAAGFFLGWRLTVTAALLAIIAGGLWGIGLLALRRADGRTRFAFGPFLCAGLAAALLWGETLITAYLGLFSL